VIILDIGKHGPINSPGEDSPTAISVPSEPDQEPRMIMTIQYRLRVL